jgi:methyl-accepting chemotaxis protein
MLRLSNIRIGIKLGIMSGVGVLLVVAMLGTQLKSDTIVLGTRLSARLQQHVAHDLQVAKSSVRSMEIAMREIQLAQSLDDLQNPMKLLEGQAKSTRELIDPMTELVQDPESRTRIEKIKGLIDNYYAGTKEVVAKREEAIELQAKGTPDTTARATTLNTEAQRTARDRMIPIVEELEKNVDIVSKAANREAEVEGEAVTQTIGSSENIAIVVGVAAMLIIVGSAVFGATTIARPLRALVRPLEEVARGNFAGAVPGLGRKDEVGQIANAVGQMISKVSTTIAEIKASGREVTNASAEISTSTTDLSQRTEEQAASLEETSAAMEELFANVKKNADNAQQACESASAAREVAGRGGQVVIKAVTAMAKIEDSSRKISDIIGVIDEIARQTNLLALNAAVEAARAGEAGRGFAVVASEVRSLAQRSSQAAKDIKELITNSNGQVKEGVDLVNLAGASLNAIVDSINTVAGIVSDIASASAEQATGLEQISKAVAQMDEVTQQNSALVEENAATAKTLEHQAKAMDERVSFFQIAKASEMEETISANESGEVSESRMMPGGREVAVSAAQKMPIALTPTAPANVHRAVSSRRGRPARRIHTALATAVNAAPDWKEF